MASKKKEVQVKPQQILIGEVEWSLAEIQELKDIYGGREGIELSKRVIRASEVIQKALKCDAVVSPRIQRGDTALLLIAQVGLDLIGKL